LFPCGSVTGAPKRRTMEIINGLEATPRGLYCGAIGYISPGREAAFSVAIRTAIVGTATGNGEIGIGSGITWDSDPDCEFQECLDKGAFMVRDSSPFQLIETLRFDRDGYLLPEQHLLRLAGSAEYLGFSLDLDVLRKQLDQLGQSLSGSHKVRILLSMDGNFTLILAPTNPPQRSCYPGSGLCRQIRSCTTKPAAGPCMIVNSRHIRTATMWSS